MIGDVCVDLIESGAVTNARKPFDRGVTVTNTVLGTRRLFDHVHDNPAVAVRPASHTHDHATLARIGDVRAINSGVEIDLTGQVNAEVAGGAYVGRGRRAQRLRPRRPRKPRGAARSSPCRRVRSAARRAAS